VSGAPTAFLGSDTLMSLNHLMLMAER
jgi:hypothetical protein